jgi:hypothetical protein
MLGVRVSVEVLMVAVVALRTFALVVVVLSVNPATPDQQRNNDLPYLFLIADQELYLILD